MKKVSQWLFVILSITMIFVGCNKKNSVDKDQNLSTTKDEIIKEESKENSHIAQEDISKEEEKDQDKETQESESEEEKGEAFTVEAIFIGYMDNNSFEAKVEGEPFAFRIEKVKDTIPEFNPNDRIKIRYIKNEYEQLMVQEAGLIE
ncbi:MAG: hypothetical protein GX347_07235 [Epulopiscium sp.]|nr:hypothetical protein [Candidatus Epulonipiscium sp.]